MIKRDKYLNQLISSMNNGMIKVITGLRRVGKSYLLFNIFYNYLLEKNIKEDHIIKFAFDSSEDLSLINEDILEINIKKRKVDPYKFNNYIKSKIIDNEKYYILLDEIQLLNSFEAVLNGYLRKDNLDIYVTGSNAKFLSKDIITEFRGRGWQINVNPLSFKEYYSVNSTNKSLNDYLLYGGLPKICEFKNELDKVQYLNSIFQETYLKDILQRNNIINIKELEELLTFLASSIGSLTNPTKLSNTFKTLKNVNINSQTIAKYIDIFNDSFLIHCPNRYNISGKKYINAPKKYYFSDLGLRNSTLNFREIEMPKLIENLVYNELINRNYNVDVGVVELYELNNKGKSVLKNTEVDFICNKIDKKYYIQVAYTLESLEKLQQEQKSLLHIKDNFKKIIIVKDTLKSHYNENGIYILSLIDFLLNENSLDY